MRISDWSSDVCSSDLPLPRRLVRHPHWPHGWHPMRADAAPRPPLTEHEPFPFVTVQGPGVYEIPGGPGHAGPIGRASGWGRGGQDVLIQGVALSIKTKNITHKLNHKSRPEQHN